MAKERLRLNETPTNQKRAVIGEAAFAAAMADFGPFERHPHMAVAVSGGADSSALAFLAKRWCHNNGGQLTALIVDHGLRSESAEEAEQVRICLAGHGITAEILPWTDQKPIAGIQKAARDARYSILDTWCRRHGVLHLLVGHHADDHAETIMMRLRRGSGPLGLAGIPALRELKSCRVIRPLIAFSRTDLVATLRLNGWDWIDDPSNDDDRFERTKIRRLLRSDNKMGSGLLQNAQAFANLRHRMERETHLFLATSVTAHPEGFAEFGTHDLLHTDPETLSRVLAFLVRGIGGHAYEVSFDVRSRLLNSLRSGRSMTAGGCLLEVRGDRVLIMRELRNIERRKVKAHQMALWDRRFQIVNDGVAEAIEVGPWSLSPFADRKRVELPTWAQNLPFPVRQTLPSIKIGDDHVAVRPGLGVGGELSVSFAPSVSLAGSGFFVA